MTHRGKSRKKATRPIPLLTTKTTTLFGTWNVRTLYVACRGEGWGKVKEEGRESLHWPYCFRVYLPLSFGTGNSYWSKVIG